LDLAVGSKGLDRGPAIDTGAVYVFFSVGELAGILDLATRPPDMVLWGGEGQRAGTALAVGDVNGDGQSDLLIGAPTAAPDGRYRAGMVYLLLGSLSQEPSELDLPAAAGLVIRGPAANARAGEAVALWDLGSDGLAEILVNIPEADAHGRSLAGLLAIWNGRVSFGRPVIDLADSEPDLTVWGDNALTRGAWSLLTTGSLDDNAQPDLLVGISDARPENRNGAGTVYGIFNVVSVQPSPTASSTATNSPTVTDTPTPTPSPTLTPTETPTPTPSAPPSPTQTQTPQPTVTTTMTATPTQAPTLTATPTAAETVSIVVYLPMVRR
jgi:hypothetical protein